MRLLLLACMLLVACNSAPSPAPPDTRSPQSISPVTPAEVVAVEAPPENETLAQYAHRLQGNHYYGMYIGGKKAGWGNMGYRVQQRDGRPLLVYRETFQFTLSMQGQKKSFRSELETCYALTGEGPIISAFEREDEDGTITVTRVEAAGDGLLVSARAQGRVTSRKVKLEHDTVAQGQRFERWLRGAKKDETFELYATDWSEDEIESPDHYTFHERELIVWGGVRTEMNKVTVTHRGGKMEALIQRDGTPWKATLGGLIELRVEDEATAKRMDQTVEMLDVTAIRIERPLDRPEDLERLVLEVDGVKGFLLPASHRQKASTVGGQTIWEFRRDFRVRAKQPLTAAQRNQYLKATPALQKDEVITKLALRVAGKGTPVQKADRLQDWVYKNLEKTYGRDASTARDVLSNKAGDCTEHARLFTALARSVGIPTREVGGLVWAAPSPMFAWHAWAEIHDGHQWVSVDPMWNQVYVDATHLKMSEGPNDYAWTQVAGSMKVKLR